MPTTTRALLRQRMSEAQSDYLSLSLTSIGGAAGATIVDTKLKQYSGGDDDFFVNWYVLPTSGTESGNQRRVKPTGGYTDSTGTLTPSTPWATQIASGVTYELHRANPTDKNNAIGRAIEELFPQLYLPVRDETIVVGDRLLNSDFESAISGNAAPSWITTSGFSTVSAETTIVRHGLQSVKMIAGSVLAQLTQTPTINVNQIIGSGVMFKMWVYATAASVARLGLDFGGGNAVIYSSYHTGGSDWELLSVSGSASATATQVKVTCDVAIGGTAYFDAGYCYAMTQQLLKYTIPSTILRGPHYVTMQADEYDPVGAYWPVLYPVNGMRLRLEGMGILTAPASDTATVEVSAPQTNLIVAQALRNLSRLNLNNAGAMQRTQYLEDMQIWEKESERLNRLGVRTMRMGAQTSRASWEIQEDGVGGNRYLVFQGGRWDQNRYYGFR